MFLLFSQNERKNSCFQFSTFIYLFNFFGIDSKMNKEKLNSNLFLVCQKDSN